MLLDEYTVVETGKYVKFKVYHGEVGFFSEGGVGIIYYDKTIKLL